MEDEEAGQGKIKLFFPKVLIKLLPYLVIGAIAAGGVIYLVRERPQLFGLSKGQADVQAETEMLIAEVGKLIALPSDENPTIATVTDTEALKDQSFFKNAQNGDKVLIYTNARKAILYRPSEKKIIEVGAVNIQEQQQEEQPPQEEPTLTPKPTGSPTPIPTEEPTPTETVTQ